MSFSKYIVFFIILTFAFFAKAQVIIPFAYWSVRSSLTITTNECPLVPQGSLSLVVNYGASDATACTFIGANPGELTGVGSCTCAAGVCTVTGLTFLNSFLAGMTPGSNFNFSSAFNYAVTRPSGVQTLSQNMIITTGTWNPNCLGTSLLMWLDATDASTVYQDTAGTTPATSATTVGLWKDKSGYLADATQATAANRPTYRTGVDTYLDFTGNNWSNVFISMNSALSQSGASGFNGNVGSMFAMVNPTSTGGNNYISIMGFRPGGGDFTGFSIPTSTTWGMDWYTNGIYNWNTGAPITTGASTILGFTSINGAQTFTQNGTTYTNTYATGSIPSRASTLTIANDGCCGNSRYFKGKIYELLAIKLNLTADLRLRLDGYLAWKYSLTGSLPAGHKFKNFAP